VFQRITYYFKAFHKPRIMLEFPLSSANIPFQRATLYCTGFVALA